MMLLVYSFFVFSFLFSEEVFFNGVAAVVGDKPILVSELEQSMLDLGKNLFGAGFSFSQMSQQEKITFKRDVLDLLIGNKIVLFAAEKDTNLVVDYSQINSFLDDNIQNLVDFEFGGSFDDFERSLGFIVYEYKYQQYEDAKVLLIKE